jgi:hypothetical protein
MVTQKKPLCAAGAKKDFGNKFFSRLDSDLDQERPANSERVR